MVFRWIAACVVLSLMVACGEDPAGDDSVPDEVTVEHQADGSIVCRPAGTGPFPVVLYNHGGLGSEIGGDLLGTCETLAGEGFLARSEQRPLTVSMAGHLEDVLAGLEELRSHGDADPSRSGVVGFSRGGLLSLQAALAVPGDVSALVLLAPAPGKGEYSMDLTLEDVSPMDGPVRVFVAENDSFQADHVAIAEEVVDSLHAHGKDAALTIYGPFGDDGHALFFEVREPYWSDVIEFLSETLGPS